MTINKSQGKTYLRDDHGQLRFAFSIVEGMLISEVRSNNHVFGFVIERIADNLVVDMRSDTIL